MASHSHKRFEDYLSVNQNWQVWKPVLKTSPLHPASASLCCCRHFALSVWSWSFDNMFTMFNFALTWNLFNCLKKFRIFLRLCCFWQFFLLCVWLWSFYRIYSMLNLALFHCFQILKSENVAESFQIQADFLLCASHGQRCQWCSCCEQLRASL